MKHLKERIGTFKGIIIVLIVIILGMSIWSIKEAYTDEHLSLESPTIELSGTLTTEMFYGRPNYGENPETDEKEYPYILVLDTPLQSENLEITKIQVVPKDHKELEAVHNAINKQVKLEGTLFSALTGHHHTPVLMGEAQLLEVDEEN